MRNFIRIISTLATLAIAPALRAAAADADELTALRAQVQALEQQLRVLARQIEIKQEAKTAAPTTAAANSVSLDEQLNQRINALEQQVKVVDHRRELDSEDASAKLKEATSKPSLFKVPDWDASVRLVGDLRMRYDAAYAPDQDFVTRWRLRPRLRLGGIVTLKDEWEIGFRLASTPSVGKDSGGDPLSTNQTFEDNGSRKPVGVDWAYARWTPVHSPALTGSFTLGKMDNPPNFTEDVFDVDYTPEGLAEQFTYKLNSDHLVSTYFGQYMLDEEQFSGKDAFLFVEQLRFESNWNKQINTAFTVSGLNIVNPESLTTANVPDSNHGNTRNAAGALVNGYRLLIADGSFTYNLERFPLYHGPFPIKLFAEYIHNFGASRNNTGYSIGPSFGRVTQTGKVQKGNWEISYRYQELQGEVNYEELTASDNGAFYRTRPVGEPYGTFRPTFLNGLNLRGHAFRWAYAPLDSLVVDARVWSNKALKVAKPGDNPEGTRVLVDLVWKF